MIRCTKCIMPDTKPGITFDEKGVCNACRNAEAAEKIDWDVRWESLLILAQEAIEAEPFGYNCLVPVSGGKDSTFMAFKARELGLNPLLVYVQPAYVTEVGKRNLQNLVDHGFDCYVFHPNRKILPELLRRSFVEEGQPARAYEFMLCSVPMQMALRFQTPLVIWGEDAQFMYGNLGTDSGAEGDAMQRSHTVVMRGQGGERWTSPTITHDQLTSYLHPTKEELEAVGVKVIYMSHYVPWDSRKNAKFAIEKGLEIRPDYQVWRSGGYWPFEQLDDEIPVVSHYIKYLKFGYGRATDQACRDIRWGYITRDEGLILAKLYDGLIDPRYIERYREFVGLTPAKFWDTALSWAGDMWERDGGVPVITLPLGIFP